MSEPLQPGAHLRVRVWEGDELVDDRIMEWGDEGIQAIAEVHVDRWMTALDAGRRCHVIVDDPDVVDGRPWMEATEEGLILIFDRQMGSVHE